MIIEYLKEQFLSPDLINKYVSTLDFKDLYFYTFHLLLVASWKALQYAKW